jgi:phospholipid/cholesterol/gamma-HCH transport system permease protein
MAATNTSPQQPGPGTTSPLLDALLTPLLLIAALGHDLLRRIVAFGRFMRFCGQIARALPHVRTWTRGDRLARQLYFVGTTSIPVLGITGAFIGMILAFEGYRQFASIGQEGRLGGIINLSLIKQLGPVLSAVMLAGRVGCALTAELGTMRVTEQLDAMRAMGSDPVRVLVVPRILACVLMIPVLTVVSNLCGMVGGFLITTRFYNADPTLYWRFTDQFIDWFSVCIGLIKAICYGLAIGVIACWKGFSCKPGAEGVGEATTDSFVTSFIAIILISLVLVKVLNDIQFWIHGGTYSVFG